MTAQDPTTAVAHAPGGTWAPVIVLGGHDALCVPGERGVAVQVRPGGEGDWTPGQQVTVRRVAITHVRRPGYDEAARSAAFLAMSSLAGRMSAGLRRAEPVTYADLRTSMDDLRAAFCLAIGIPVRHVSRSGYNVGRGGECA